MGHLLAAVAFVYLSLSAWSIAQASVKVLEYRMAVLRFPLWPFKILFAFGLSLMALQLIINAIKAFSWPRVGKAMPASVLCQRPKTPVSVKFPLVPTFFRSAHMKRLFIKLATATLIASSFPITVLAQELQPQTWKMAIATGEKSWFGDLHKWWGSEVEKRSGGKIKIQYFWSDSLVKWGDALPGIQSGIADLAWVSSSYHPAQLPNYMSLDHMFNYGDDYVAAVKAALETMDNQPDLKAELAKNDVVPLMSHISGLAPVGTKTALTNMDVLKGKTLRTYGGARTDFYKNLGWNPVFMVFSDMYPAIDRGTIDALGELVILLSNVFKLNEVVNHVHMMNPPGLKGNGGVVGSAFFMSGKKFRSLPPATQKCWWSCAMSTVFATQLNS